MLWPACSQDSGLSLLCLGKAKFASCGIQSLRQTHCSLLSPAEHLPTQAIVCVGTARGEQPCLCLLPHAFFSPPFFFYSLWFKWNSVTERQWLPCSRDKCQYALSKHSALIFPFFSPLWQKKVSAGSAKHLEDYVKDKQTFLYFLLHLEDISPPHLKRPLEF